MIDWVPYDLFQKRRRIRKKNYQTGESHQTSFSINPGVYDIPYKNGVKKVWYNVHLTNTSTLHVDTLSSESGDTVLVVFNETGHVIGYNDDLTTTWLSSIDLPNLPSGTYYIVVMNYPAGASNGFNISFHNTFQGSNLKLNVIF